MNLRVSRRCAAPTGGVAALEQNVRVSPDLATAQLGDLSGAVGSVVAALHTVYRNLGVEEAAVVRLPTGSALAADEIARARGRG